MKNKAGEISSDEREFLKHEEARIAEEFLKHEEARIAEEKDVNEMLNEATNFYRGNG